MAFIIPTIFTASNQLSRPLAQMQQGMQQLANAADGAKRAIQGMMSVMGEDANNRLNYMISLGKAMAVTGTALFAGKSLLDYDKAITKFRTIVSDLNDVDFNKFKAQMNSAAKAVGASAIDMFQAAEVIAGLDEKFAANPALLADMSKAAYTLSKGGFMELADAAEGMTGIMLQFNMQAAEADRVINALAAGTAKGGASIASQIESMRKFGSEAHRANMSLELTIGTLQAIAPKAKGAEAGDALSAIMIRMRRAMVGIRGGEFNFINAIDDINNRMAQMGDNATKNLFLDNLFGADRSSIGAFVLAQRDNIVRLTAAVTATNEAHRAAQIAASSLGGRIELVKNKFVNFVTQSEKSNYLMTKFGNVLSFVANNFDTLMRVATPFVVTLVSLKAFTIGVAVVLRGYTTAIRLYNYYQGIATVVTKSNVWALRSNADAMNAAVIANKFLRMGLAAQITLVGVATAALAVLTYMLWPTTDATDALATSVDATGKAFSDLGRPITDAEAKLALFNKQQEKYIQQRNEMALSRQREALIGSGAIKLNPFEEIAYSMQQAFRSNPIIANMLPYFMSQPVAPNAADFGVPAVAAPDVSNFVTQASQVSVPQAVNSTYTESSTTTNKSAVEITVRAEPGSEAKVSSNTGGIPVRTTQTATGR